MIRRTRSDSERRGMFAAMRSATSRYMERHPGVRQSLRRTAVVGAYGGLLVALGMRNARLARGAFGNMRAATRHIDHLRWIAGGRRVPAGLRPAVTAARHSRARWYKQAVKRRRRITGLSAASFAVIPGGLWASGPAVEDLERWREWREARRSAPVVQVIVRRRGRA